MKTRKHMRGRALALLLSLTMCLGTFQMPVFASETTEPAATEASVASEGTVEESEATPAESEAAPEEPEAAPEESEAAPEESVAAPEESTPTTEESAVTPDESVETPGEIAGTSEETAETEEETTEVSEESVTVPEETNEVSEEPATASEEPVYASIDEFMAAVEAIGNAGDYDSTMAALDAIDAIYAALSPEDQMNPEVFAAYQYAMAYRKNVDGDLDSLALISGESFTVNVVKVVNGNKAGQVTLTQRCLQSTGHSGYNHSTNLRALANASGFSGYKGYNWSKYTTVPGSYTQGLCPNNNYAGVHYNITGSAPYKADETLFLFFENVSYTLTYNANGGSGAPGIQTGSSDTGSHTFDISTTIPTRVGYEFLGWADNIAAQNPNYVVTNKDGVVTVSPARITLQKSAPTKTIYAVWKAKSDKVTLTYKDRGTLYSEKSYDRNADVTIITCTNTRKDYKFLGWDTDSSADEVIYEAGDGITLTENITLYAVWKKMDTYSVKYKWEGLPEGDGRPALPAEAKYSADATVTVDNNNKAGDTVTVNGVTYKFSGWNKFTPNVTVENGRFTMPERDVLIEGTWVVPTVPVTPGNDVRYLVQWFDKDGNELKESEVRGPGKIGTEVSVTSDDKTDIISAGDTYTFDPVDKRNVLDGILSKDKAIILKLYFNKISKYNVSYEWTGLPAEANETLPKGGTYEKDASVTVDSQYTNGKEVSVGDKTYTFSGWRTEDAAITDGVFTMPGKDVVISGTWTEKTETGTDPDPNPGTDPDPNPGTDPDPNPGTDPDPNPGTDPDPNPGTDPDPNPGTDPGPNPGTDPTPDPGTASTPDPGTDPLPVPPAIPTPALDLVFNPTQIDILDPVVPLTNRPDWGPIGEPVEESVEIIDEEVPLANVPKTGDDSRNWIIFTLLSGLALVWLKLSGNKNKKQAD